MTFQRNRMITLLNNYDQALVNNETALNAAGTANKKFEIYQESAAAQTDRLKASVEGLYQSLLSSDSLKTVIKDLTEFVGWVQESNAVLPILAGIVTTILVGSLLTLRGGISAINIELIKMNALSAGIPLLIGAVVTGVAWFATNQIEANKASEKSSEYLGDNIKSYKTLSTELQNINKTYDDSKKKNDEAADSINKNSQALEKLTKNSNRTAYEKKKLVTVVAELNKAIPGLNLNYNEENDLLTGQTDKVKELAEAQIKLQEATALEDKNTGLISNIEDASIAIDGYKEKLDELRTQKEALDKIISSKESLNSTYASTEDMNILKDARIERDKLNKKIEETSYLFNSVSDSVKQNSQELQANQNALVGYYKAQSDANIATNNGKDILYEENGALKVVQGTNADLANSYINNEIARYNTQKAVSSGIIANYQKELQALAALSRTKVSGLSIMGGTAKVSDPFGNLYSNSVMEKKLNEDNAAYVKAMNDLSTANKELDKLNSLSSSIKASAVSGGSAGAYTRPAESGGKAGSVAKEVEQYFSELDVLTDLDEQYKQINEDLKKNQALMDSLDLEGQNKALIERVGLLNQQNELLSFESDIRKDQINNILPQLQNLGFNTVYDVNTNQLVIKNLAHINDLKGSDVEATNEIRKATEELIKKVYDLNDANNEAAASMMETVNTIQNTLLSNLKDSMSKYMDGLKDSTNLQTEKIDSMISLYKSFFEVSNSIKEEQMSIDNELEKNQAKYANFSQEMKDAYFNDSDYRELSGKLNQIGSEANALFEDYQNKINNINQDSLYTLEEVTNEFERQYNLKMKEYEISKQSLALAKAEQNLANVQSQKTTRMFTGSKFEWVVDPKALEDAMDQVASAQTEIAKAQMTYDQEALIQGLEQQKGAAQTQLDAITSKWEELSKALETPVADITDALNDIALYGIPKLKDIVTQLGEQMGLSVLTQDQAVAKMKANSAQWGSASSTKQQELANENLAIGTTMGWHRDNNGIWYLPSGQRAYDDGGIAEGIGVLPKNTLKPERVLSPQQTKSFDKLVETIASNDNLSFNKISRNNILPLSTSKGNISSETNSMVVNIGTVVAQNASSFINELKRMTRSR